MPKTWATRFPFHDFFCNLFTCRPHLGFKGDHWDVQVRRYESLQWNACSRQQFPEDKHPKRKGIKMKTHSTHWIIPIIFCGLLFMPWLVADEAHGQRRDAGRVRAERYHEPPPREQGEPVVTQPRHAPRGGYHGQGRDYRTHRRDYRAPYRGPAYNRGSVGYHYHRPRMPVGSVVRHLPPGHRRMLHRNHIYYEYRGDYYRREPGGYIVISIPFFFR